MGPLARQPHTSHTFGRCFSRGRASHAGLCPGAPGWRALLAGRARSDDYDRLRVLTRTYVESERVDVGYHRFARANAESTLPLVARCVIASSVSAPRIAYIFLRSNMRISKFNGRARARIATRATGARAERDGDTAWKRETERLGYC